MQESSNNSTSSAAAMADSASTAVAGSAKSTGGNAAGSAKTVKLLIKASNQQFDDHTIECDLQWSVKRLKVQLSLVYPCKPAVSEQKLIYSGQLLNDSLLLKDVIRSYKDVLTQNHIFHLVCASKHLQASSAKQIPSKANSSMSSNSNAATTSPTYSTDGLRFRNNTNNTEAVEQAHQSPMQDQLQPDQRQQQQQHVFHTVFNSSVLPQMLAGGNGLTNVAASNCPNFNANAGPGRLPFSFPGQFNMHSLATQQAVMYNWMHQVYSQYMDQYLRLSNNMTAGGLPTVVDSGDASTSASSSNMPPVNAIPFATPPFLQQMPFITNNLTAENFTAIMASGTAAQHPVISVQNPVGSEATVAASMSQVAATAVAGPEQRPNADSAARVGGSERQSPRFPANIPQTDPEHNDWLDILFSLARLGIFLMILVFNASPLRCLYVIIIAGILYLYQTGYLRFLRERNNNNINRNNNAGDAANQIRQGIETVQQAQAEQQQQAGPSENLVTTPTQSATGFSSPATETVPSTSSTAAFATKAAFLMSFIRTFVVSFFISLLPEQQTQ